MQRIPKLCARTATARAMRPKPISARVAPRMSPMGLIWASQAGMARLPRRHCAHIWGTRRTEPMMRNIAASAVCSVAKAGRLPTTTPAAVAASRSTWSTPTVGAITP